MAGAAFRMKGAWNHNTHYHRTVLGAMPSGAKRALDVGCGEGGLLADLVPAVPLVVGIDADKHIIGQAVRAAPTARVVNGDFLTYPFQPESFDLIAAIGSLHHMDLASALGRVAEALRPGGVAVVIGLARPATVRDYIVETSGVVVSKLMRRVVGYKEVHAPTVWPPPLTYAECRRIGTTVLPGARFRRRLFFRYSLVWTKPERNR